MIPDRPLAALRGRLDHTFNRLALPGTHLVRMELVLRGNLQKRSVAQKRLQRYLGLQTPDNLRRLPRISIVPSDGGIHLNGQSDFPVPPQIAVGAMNELPKRKQAQRWQQILRSHVLLPVARSCRNMAIVY